jgi:hypothetical protein
MRREVLMVVSLSCAVLTVSCEQRRPLGPSSSATLDQFVQALRQQGFNVTLADQIRPEVNRFFSVPAHQLRVDESQVNAFEYPSSEAAVAEAALISPDGQPSPVARISWVSTPRFYHQGRLIVLYVGCSTEIVQALQATVGTPIAIGPTPCDLHR